VSDSSKNNKGFTLPEVMVALSVFAILSTAFLTLMIQYFANISRNNSFIDMTTSSQNLLRNTVEQLRYSAGVRQTNTITDTNGPSGGWNTSNTSFVIIIAAPAKDTNDNFIIDSSTGEPYLNELVYFKQNDDLYRRILANPSASGNSIKTTCPAASATSSCPADAKLIDYLDDMVFTLYDQDDAATNNPLLARSVKIDLFLEHDTFGDPLTLQNSIRVTLRNTY
jgi:prepilin-type N-terminal cleavage/methylation domain-containing protein